jgi:methylglyoxal synthase
MDGTGKLWGIPGPANNRYADYLICFEAGLWRDAGFKKPEGTERAVALRNGPGGSVLCFWKAAGETCVVTRHRGAEIGVVVGTLQIAPEYDGDELLCHVDSRGDAWITGKSPDIVRITANGQAEVMYRIKPGELRGTRGNQRETFNAILCREDPEGQLWFGSADYATNVLTLRGFLKFDGTAFHHLPRPRNTPEDLMFQLFVPLGGDKLWANLRNDSKTQALGLGTLVELDLAAGLARKVEEPEKDAFRAVESLAAIGGAIFVGTEVYREGSSLFRWRDGVWTKLLAKYDPGEESPYEWQRQIAVVPGGVLVFGLRETPWFAAEDGSGGVPFDWRAGLPLRRLKRLLQLRDATYLAVGNGEAFMGALQIPPASAGDPRVREIVTNGGWSLDPKGRLWTGVNRSGEAIQAWDGEKWLKYELPKKGELRSFSRLAADTKGRVWLFPNENNTAAGYFDPATETWHASGSIEAAYQTMAHDLPIFTGRRPPFQTPRADAEGRKIAFRRSHDELSLFDGASWKTWKLTQIVPGKRFWFRGSPFFTAEGRLRVALGIEGISTAVWEFGAGDIWQAVEGEDLYPDREAPGPQPALPPVILPAGCVTNHPDSAVSDEYGVVWLTWRGSLYRAVEGACVRVFDVNERSPFSDGRTIAGVARDARGNFILETGRSDASSVSEPFLLKPAGPLPAVQLSVEKTGADSGLVHLQSDAPGRRFQVRLSGRPWQSIHKDKLELTHLSSGEHQVEAVALDEQLQASTPLAVVKIQVAIDPAAQIVATIAHLREPTQARREAAVAALVRIGASANVPLRQARASADESLQWWIDVALQEIERRPGGSK